MDVGFIKLILNLNRSWIEDTYSLCRYKFNWWNYFFI